MMNLRNILFSLGVLLAGTSLFGGNGALTHVTTEKVCMVTNKVFPTAQIPIQIDEKTYYGCCKMCKQQIVEKPELRSALDPLSKVKVDKALAYIGADKTGSVFYFKNSDNFKKYNAALQ